MLKFCFFQDHGSEPSSPNTAPENALEAAVKARREKDKGGMFKAENSQILFYSRFCGQVLSSLKSVVVSITQCIELPNLTHSKDKGQTSNFSGDEPKL